jgi:hypothetical protein
MIEVTLHKRGQMVRRFCFQEGLEGVLHALCTDFPRAEVQYHPDSAYGFVAQIRCCCGSTGSQGCCRCSGQDSASVTLVLSRKKTGGNAQITPNGTRSSSLR